LSKKRCSLKYGALEFRKGEHTRILGAGLFDWKLFSTGYVTERSGLGCSSQPAVSAEFSLIQGQAKDHHHHQPGGLVLALMQHIYIMYVYNFKNHDDNTIEGTNDDSI
jgi:hypothetical protein